MNGKKNKNDKKNELLEIFVTECVYVNAHLQMIK